LPFVLEDRHHEREKRDLGSFSDAEKSHDDIDPDLEGAETDILKQLVEREDSFLRDGHLTVVLLDGLFEIHISWRRLVICSMHQLGRRHLRITARSHLFYRG
jgi:hypothetical protein